jgi:hypothetical protein
MLGRLSEEYRIKRLRTKKKNQLVKKSLQLYSLKKIDAVSFKAIKEVIVKFIRDDKVLEIWSPAYFKELVRHI